MHNRLVPVLSNFSSSIYNNLAFNATQNVVFSPFSVYLALFMTMLGARQNTMQEMRQTLLPNNENLGLSIVELTNITRTISSTVNPGVFSNIVNGMFVDTHFLINPSYELQLTRLFDAHIENMNFSTTPEESRVEINSWISNSTNGTIPELLPPLSITSSTRMVLVSTLYFNGAWELPFPIENTRNVSDFFANFSTIPSSKVSMMSMNEKSVLYGEHIIPDEFRASSNATIQSVTLLYQGGEFGMIFILPPENSEQSMTFVEEYLFQENGNFSILQLLKEQQLQQLDTIEIPRFTFSYTSEMKPVLEKIGMEQMFTEQANFSGISSTSDLWIDEIVHEAFILVRENGTVASAATAVIGVGTAAPPENQLPSFVANRPFLFALVNMASETILFLGKVLEPVSPE